MDWLLLGLVGRRALARADRVDVAAPRPRRYVLMQGDALLLKGWTWIAVDYLLRRVVGPPVMVWVFRSTRSAEQARRSYGRGAWRAMTIVRVHG